MEWHTNSNYTWGKPRRCSRPAVRPCHQFIAKPGNWTAPTPVADNGIGDSAANRNSPLAGQAAGPGVAGSTPDSTRRRPTGVHQRAVSVYHQRSNPTSSECLGKERRNDMFTGVRLGRMRNLRLSTTPSWCASSITLGITLLNKHFTGESFNEGARDRIII